MGRGGEGGWKGRIRKARERGHDIGEREGREGEKEKERKGYRLAVISKSRRLCRYAIVSVRQRTYDLGVVVVNVR